MARAYSLDLRERVVAAVAAGASCRAVAATFKVSVASVVKWSQRFRATGSAAAQQDGRPAAAMRWRASATGFWRGSAEQPDLTLRAIGGGACRRVASRSSYFAVWHFFVHEGISFKKKPARQRAGSARRGAAAGAVAKLSRPA